MLVNTKMKWSNNDIKNNDNNSDNDNYNENNNKKNNNKNNNRNNDNNNKIKKTHTHTSYSLLFEPINLNISSDHTI